MQRRRRQSSARPIVVLGCALAVLVGCASDDVAADDFPSPEYIFGGQTGSLVPNCGVAPLSQARRAVPLGDALAVLYTSGCPEGVSAAPSLTGPGARSVGVRLEPLASGVYLVRVDEEVAAGDYQLGLADESSTTLAVAEEASPLPDRLGRIAALPESAACGQDLTFEWELDPAALAHAPLLRLWVSVDGGEEQLWIDYGALELETPATGAARLRLPRCGSSSCLEGGRHELVVRAELAGENLSPEPLDASFELRCAAADSSSFAANDAGSSAACSVAGRTRPMPVGAVLVALVFGWRRLRQYRVARRKPPA